MSLYISKKNINFYLESFNLYQLVAAIINKVRLANKDSNHCTQYGYLCNNYIVYV